MDLSFQWVQGLEDVLRKPCLVRGDPDPVHLQPH